MPVGAFVPAVRVDKVSYRDSAPWPAGADGGGLSLQRRVAHAYGNDPANWVAAAPTAGGANASSPTAPPVITQSPASTNVLINSDLRLQATATGAGPISWQWRFNGAELADRTNATLFLDYLRVEDAGAYDVYAINSGGPAYSAAAKVVITEPAIILAAAPSPYSTNGGSNVTFTVAASGTPPLIYQWKFEGADIPGATTPSLTLTNLTLAQCGVYGLTISNAFSVATTNMMSRMRGSL